MPLFDTPYSFDVPISPSTVYGSTPYFVTSVNGGAGTAVGGNTSVAGFASAYYASGNASISISAGSENEWVYLGDPNSAVGFKSGYNAAEIGVASNGTVLLADGDHTSVVVDINHSSLQADTIYNFHAGDLIILRNLAGDATGYTTYASGSNAVLEVYTQNGGAAYATFSGMSLSTLNANMYQCATGVSVDALGAG